MNLYVFTVRKPPIFNDNALKLYQIAIMALSIRHLLDIEFWQFGYRDMQVKIRR